MRAVRGEGGAGHGVAAGLRGQPARGLLGTGKAGGAEWLVRAGRGSVAGSITFGGPVADWWA